MQVVMKSLGEIHPYENNPRINDKAAAAVAKSIEAYGFKVPIVIAADGEIVCGHTRYKAAQELKLKEVPYQRKASERVREWLAQVDPKRI